MFNFGILGCGMIANVHADAISCIENATVPCLETGTLRSLALLIIKRNPLKVLLKNTA